ncbi:hypothetical protein QBC36DRAFT_84202 [Triangularia setosa]|uniref:TauD/TfdA-like domain-containing protein n=1 Tax=Triangularia setosa TaxID=2587417 RepID=A0AAN7AAL6_9PEZI|nr:hypothetical protein QBC36DRAFT_84202 [Podospora setosa]
MWVISLCRGRAIVWAMLGSTRYNTGSSPSSVIPMTQLWTWKRLALFNLCLKPEEVNYTRLKSAMDYQAGGSMPGQPLGWLEHHTMAWSPEAISSDSYVVDIGLLGAREVEEGLRSFKELELDGHEINRHNFHLPTLSARLGQACHEVHRGRGFVIIRGIDPLKYSVEDNVMIYLGIAAYIGEQRGFQDKKGNMLTHITASKDWKTPPELRHGIHTNSSLMWHCDMGVDILALHVRSLAERGGDTFIASSFTIVKELKFLYPHVIQALQEVAWPIQVSGNPVPRYILAPLLHIDSGNNLIILSVDPGRLGVHPSTMGTDGTSPIPPLDPTQLEALRVLNQVASKYRLRLDTKPGDMVFLNNFTHLHARDAYSDPGQGQGRHLVRLYLRNPTMADPVPKPMRVPWEAAFGPRVTEERYPVVPALEYSAPRYTAGSAAFPLDDNDDANGNSAA